MIQFSLLYSESWKRFKIVHAVYIFRTLCQTHVFSKILLTLTNKPSSTGEVTPKLSILCRFSDSNFGPVLAQSTCIRYQLSEQIIVYVSSATKFIVHSLYIPLSSILEIFTFILHTCSIKNDPKSYFVGFAQWEIKHYCRKRPFPSAQVWAEGQHEPLKMVRFDYLCINFQTFCVFKTMSVR